jgi:hypothetical protein
VIGYPENGARIFYAYDFVPPWDRRTTFYLQGHLVIYFYRQVYANDNERQTLYCGGNYSKEGCLDPLPCGYNRKTYALKSRPQGA